MTTWDKIYKNYKKGGEAYATLSHDMESLFISFIAESKFDKKSALDIGCGTGKYLKFLKERGFEVSGIDSSESAIEMTSDILGTSKDIKQANMYEYKIPKNKYDLILSISSLHHGTKAQVSKLINEIHDSLIIGGKIFITLPDIECNKKWNMLKNNKELAPGTYAPLSGPEKGLAHSLFSKEEVETLFATFDDLHLHLDDIGRWFVIGAKAQ